MPYNPYAAPQSITKENSPELEAIGISRLKACSASLLLSFIVVAVNVILFVVALEFVRSTASTGNRLSALFTFIPLAAFIVLPSGIMVVANSIFGLWNGVASLLHPLTQSNQGWAALYLACHAVLGASPVIFVLS